MRKLTGDELKSCLVLMVVIAVLEGCSAFAPGYMAEGPKIGAAPRPPRGSNISSLPALGDRLVSALIEGMHMDFSGKGMVVTTFVDINDLSKSSRFGRAMQEAVINSLIRHGIPVKDVRRGSAIKLAPGKGELILTRDQDDLEQKIYAELVLAGTYAETPATVMVSARIMDYRTRLSLASTVLELVKTPSITALLKDSSAITPSVVDTLLEE